MNRSKCLVVGSIVAVLATIIFFIRYNYDQTSYEKSNGVSSMLHTYEKKKNDHRITIYNNTAGEGIDISKYQGEINWQKAVLNNKFGFMYVRATYGNKIKDRYYSQNIDSARSHYIPVGSYHYYLNTISPEEQFESFMSMVDVDKQDLIPMVDVEDDSFGPSILWSPKKLQTFLNLVEKEFGVKPIIYTSRIFYNSYLYKNFSEYPVWIASYTPKIGKLRGGKQYLLWQYSDKGRINGVYEHIDKNRLHPDATIKDLLLRK